MEDRVTCPKCGSDQISITNRGFDSASGIICCILTGGIGLLVGLIGSGRKVKVCAKCGNRF